MVTQRRSPPRYARTFAAGADHVIMMANGADFTDGVDRLIGLSSALVA
jgi:hypothetical protein